MSLKKLAAESSATNLAFFGKIRGTVTDYYIVEAAVEREEGEGKEGMEAPGNGVNKSVFYVTKDSKSPWTNSLVGGSSSIFSQLFVEAEPVPSHLMIIQIRVKKNRGATLLGVSS